MNEKVMRVFINLMTYLIDEENSTRINVLALNCSSEDEFKAEIKQSICNPEKNYFGKECTIEFATLNGNEIKRFFFDGKFINAFEQLLEYVCITNCMIITIKYVIDSYVKGIKIQKSKRIDFVVIDNQ